MVVYLLVATPRYLDKGSPGWIGLQMAAYIGLSTFVRARV